MKELDILSKVLFYISNIPRIILPEQSAYSANIPLVGINETAALQLQSIANFQQKPNIFIAPFCFGLCRLRYTGKSDISLQRFKSVGAEVWFRYVPRLSR